MFQQLLGRIATACSIARMAGGPVSECLTQIEIENGVVDKQDPRKSAPFLIMAPNG